MVLNKSSKLRRQRSNNLKLKRPNKANISQKQKKCRL